MRVREGVIHRLQEIRNVCRIRDHAVRITAKIRVGRAHESKVPPGEHEHDSAVPLCGEGERVPVPDLRALHKDVNALRWSDCGSGSDGTEAVEPDAGRVYDETRGDGEVVPSNCIPHTGTGSMSSLVDEAFDLKVIRNDRPRIRGGLHNGKHEARARRPCVL